MSWSLLVNPIEKDGFAAAVDAAEPVGENAQTKLGQKQVVVAKKALKELAKLVQRPKISGSASGHAWDESQGENMFDGLSLYVSGSK